MVAFDEFHTNTEAVGLKLAQSTEIRLRGILGNAGHLVNGAISAACLEFTIPELDPSKEKPKATRPDKETPFLNLNKIDFQAHLGRVHVTFS